MSRAFDLPELRSIYLRRGRIPGLRTAKTTLAAVLAFVVADLLHTSDEPVLAPLTALIIVQLTLYSTVRHGFDRVLSVVAGVLIAVGVASLTGLTWWSLGAVVALSLVAGRFLRLGPNLMEVPISAMLVLAAAGLGPQAIGEGAAKFAAFGRVAETLVGALVGLTVNLIVAPPIYIQPAAAALKELSERMSTFTRELATALRGEWTRADADRFLDGARRLGDEVVRADRHLARTEESARLNPRGRLAREARPRLRVALTGFEHCYMSLRNLCRAVLDRTFFVPEVEVAAAYSPEARGALADMLDAFADAIDAVEVDVPVPGAPPAAVKSADMLARRDELAALLLVDPLVDAAAWEQHGALLAAVDRLRVEAEATARPGEGSWRPEPVTARQRAAVRKALRGVGRQRSVQRRRAVTRARAAQKSAR